MYDVCVLRAVSKGRLVMGEHLLENYAEVVAIMDTAVYLFLAEKGYISGHIAPIVVNGDLSPETYINPVPSGLVLTGIVVSVSVTALMLSLTIRLYRRYHTLDLDEISIRVKREER